MSQDRAIEIARAALTGIGARPGEWRVAKAEMWERTEGTSLWWVLLHRHVTGLCSELEYANFIVDPYEAGVALIGLHDTCIRLPQNASLIQETEARATADSALRSFCQGYVLPEDEIEPKPHPRPNPCWAQVATHSPVCRLAFIYHYYLQGITNNRADAIVEVRVDAQTGELWWVKMVSGGGKPMSTKLVPPNARIALAGNLLAAKETAAIGRALAAGGPVAASDPPASARSLPTGTGEFRLAEKTKQL